MLAQKIRSRKFLEKVKWFKGTDYDAEATLKSRYVLRKTFYSRN